MAFLIDRRTPAKRLRRIMDAHKDIQLYALTLADRGNRRRDGLPAN